MVRDMLRVDGSIVRVGNIVNKLIPNLMHPIVHLGVVWFVSSVVVGPQ